MTTSTPKTSVRKAVSPPAASLGLAPLGKRPPLPTYIRQVLSRMRFATELARSRMNAENEADRLGVAWIVLRPLINAAVYGSVFSLILPREGNYVGWIVIGVFLFQFFSSCFQDGAKAIVQNMGLVTTLRFPRALLPIAIVVQQTMALGPMVAVMVVVVVASKLFRGEDPFTVEWLALIPALLLFALFNTGVAFFAARITIHARDIAQLIPFAARILFYLSGVIFEVKDMHGPHVIQTVLNDNPIAIYIEMARHGLLDAQWPTMHMWIWGSGVALVMLILGFVWFWQAEELYGRE